MNRGENVKLATFQANSYSPILTHPPRCWAHVPPREVRCELLTPSASKKALVTAGASPGPGRGSQPDHLAALLLLDH